MHVCMCLCLCMCMCVRVCVCVCVCVCVFECVKYPSHNIYTRHMPRNLYHFST